MAKPSGGGVSPRPHPSAFGRHPPHEGEGELTTYPPLLIYPHDHLTPPHGEGVRIQPKRAVAVRPSGVSLAVEPGRVLSRGARRGGF